MTDAFLDPMVKARLRANPDLAVTGRSAHDSGFPNPSSRGIATPFDSAGTALGEEALRDDAFRRAVESKTPAQPAPVVATVAQPTQQPQQRGQTSGTSQDSFIRQNKLSVGKIKRPRAKRGNRSSLLSNSGSARLG